jgi:hypothetical protein
MEYTFTDPGNSMGNLMAGCSINDPGNSMGNLMAGCSINNKAYWKRWTYNLWKVATNI